MGTSVHHILGTSTKFVRHILGTSFSTKFNRQVSPSDKIVQTARLSNFLSEIDSCPNIIGYFYFLYGIPQKGVLSCVPIRRLYRQIAVIRGGSPDGNTLCRVIPDISCAVTHYRNNYIGTALCRYSALMRTLQFLMSIAAPLEIIMCKIKY